MSFFSRWRWRKAASDDESVYITEKYGVRSLHIGSDTIQSSMRLARPNDLELAYTRSMMAFLLFHAAPSRVLMVGLGGGSLAKFVYHEMPETANEVLEINPQVVAVARRMFELPAGDGRLTVRVCDGAEFMARDGPTYDAIMVDGYDGESQVEALSSRVFYAACQRRLAAGGMLVVNLWGSDRAFDDYVERIEATFRAGTLCLPAERPGNVIVLAFRDAPGNPSWNELDRRARALEARYRLEFGKFVRSLRKMNRWDEERLYTSDAA